MKIREQNVDRRTVIEAYVTYDCSKKGVPKPDFEKWDWSSANAIDIEMCRASWKGGVPAGYLRWDEVELTMSDLRKCAIDVKIFSEKSRRLGDLERVGCLVGWKHKPENRWYQTIASGQTFDETAPFLLRPAVRGEQLASWYIEDGSGRAVAFLQNQSKFHPSQTLVFGYLGREPDPNSTFMQKEFAELLANCSGGLRSGGAFQC